MISLFEERQKHTKGLKDYPQFDSSITTFRNLIEILQLTKFSLLFYNQNSIEPSLPTLLKYYFFYNIFGASLDVKETRRIRRQALDSTN